MFRSATSESLCKPNFRFGTLSASGRTLEPKAYFSRYSMAKMGLIDQWQPGNHLEQQLHSPAASANSRELRGCLHSGLTTLSSEQPSDLATSTPQRPSFGHGDTCGLECARVAGSHCQSCSWRDRRAKAHMHDIRKNDVLVIVCHEELWSQEIGLSCMS